MSSHFDFQAVQKPAFFEKKADDATFSCACADFGYLCVCQPLFLRVPPFFSTTVAGACDTLILSHATKLWIRVGRETLPVSCACDATVDHAVQFCFFASMVVCVIPPLNPSFAAVSCRARRSRTADVHQTIVDTPSILLDFSPYRSLTFLLNVGIQLTANQCHSVSV